MKKRQAVALLLICLILLPLHSTESAQVQPFDLKKCRQELEIMKGILRTTLGFASKELASSYTSQTENESARAFAMFTRGDFSSINAFYLAGQGAVFTIPASSLREALRARKEFKLKNAFNLKPGGLEINFDERAIHDLVAQAQDLAAEFAYAGGFGLEEPVPVSPPLARVPPAAPQDPAPSPAPAAPGRARTDKEPSSDKREQRDQDRKKLSELQERVRRRAQEDEASRAKFREAVDQLKEFLIEALANHGDSMTIVKPDEYINIVIAEEGHGFWPNDSRQAGERDILSVRKAVISDYKAGRLTLEAFKQKVMNYEN